MIASFLEKSAERSEKLIILLETLNNSQHYFDSLFDVIITFFIHTCLYYFV